MVLSLAIALKPSSAIAQFQAPQPFLLTQSVNSETATTLHVDPVNGDDATADGSDRAPFKTITRALEAAEPNTIIQLAPGTYSSQTGETFPIALKPRVTLQGNLENRGQDVIIRGGGTFTSPSLPRQTITILGGANHAALIGVTVTNPNPDGYGIQIESSNPTITSNTFTGNGRGGVILAGSSDSLIRNNFFYQNGANGISIHGTARSTIQDNIFEQTEVGIVVNDDAAPSIVSNRITQNKTGVMLQGKGQPKLRGNSVESNAQYGLRAIAQAKPDVASSGADANFFRNNGKQDIFIESTATGNSETREERSLETAEKPTAATKHPATPPPEPPKPRAVGNVVVPVVPIVQPATTSPAKRDRPSAAPTRQSPAPSTEPKLSATPEQPSRPSISTNTAREVSAVAFPMPTALSDRDSNTQPAKPIQIVRMERSPVELSSAVSEMPSAVVGINQAPQAQSTPRPIPAVLTNSFRNAPQPGITVERTPAIPAPASLLLDEIPAPPPVSRKAAAPSVQPISPQPGSFSPSPAPTSSRSIPIPVPLPETEQTASVPRVTQPLPVPASASSQQLKQDNQSGVRLGSLLPVPSSTIPIGNIGDMPSVYSAQGDLSQGNAVVVKYRVIVVTTDDTQQEQTRSLVPNAFPVIYRGQRVLQAGAFGDRAKAEQLVAALGNQGLQAVVEPLK